ARLRLYADESGSRAVASWRLQTEPMDEGRSPASSSKLGGEPALPPGVNWPARRNGVPLAFLAQINLADIASYACAKLLPRSGLLLFVYDNAQESYPFYDFWTGHDTDSGENSDAARVILV